MPRSNFITVLVAALPGTTATTAADISDGLIAWYPLDQGVVDRTGSIEPFEGESILPIITGKFCGAAKFDVKPILPA